MGIPGILKEIGKGERTALSKLAIEHFERHNRPLRIAIDAAIWNFQTLSGQGGKNPALRTLFFRLLKLLSLPIQPVFIYDGKNKPLTKRGRTVRHYQGTCVPNELSKALVGKFSYPWHVAPGEAEAECAFLQKKGVVDMVMSQDADAIMFGAGTTLRDWSKEGTRGNKGPTHVNVMSLTRLYDKSQLDCDGIVLVAMLSGGDYNEGGIPGFGISLACEIARAGFGRDLLELVRNEKWDGLQEWRDRLTYELENNESGYFKRRHKTVKVPDTFPDLAILNLYMKPTVSNENDVQSYKKEWERIWASEIDVPALRVYTASMFDWCWKSGARRFVRCLAQPLFQSRLGRGLTHSSSFSVDNITESRQHFVNDGLNELRFSATPADIVGIDIEAEEDNSNYARHSDDNVEQDDGEDGVQEQHAAFAVMQMSNPDVSATQVSVGTESLPVKHNHVPWNPFLPEKWWIPQTLLELGLPELVEDWHQLQRDIRADPLKFALRKTAKRPTRVREIDPNMKNGAIRGYFKHVSKSTESRPPSKSATFPAAFGNEDDPAITKNISVVESDRNALGLNAPTKQQRKQRMAKHIDLTGREDTDYPATIEKLGKSTAATSNIAQNSPNPLEQCTISSQSSQKQPTQSSKPKNAVSATFKPTQPKESSYYNSPQKQSGPKPYLDLSQHDDSGIFAKTQIPIESFFIVKSKNSPGRDIDRGSYGRDVRRPEITVFDPPSQPDFREKNVVRARESLPGTWQEVDRLDRPRRNQPRVSYVDLTSD